MECHREAALKKEHKRHSVAIAKLRAHPARDIRCSKRYVRRLASRRAGDPIPHHGGFAAAPRGANQLAARAIEALYKLACEYPRQAQVVELRFFGGLSAEEACEILTATAVESSLRTVELTQLAARAITVVEEDED